MSSLECIIFECDFCVFLVFTYYFHILRQFLNELQTYKHARFEVVTGVTMKTAASGRDVIVFAMKWVLSWVSGSVPPM
jgi:hypothetical protein